MTKQVREKIISDRIKLPLIFDYQKMQQEIEALNLGDFNHYSTLPLRAPAHIIDSSIPFPPPAKDYADGSWTDWLDAKELKSSPYLLNVVDTFRKHCKVTLVRLLRLAPQEIINEHTDPTLGLHIEKSVIRLTVPIQTTKGVTFFLNGTPVKMELGECWYLRLTDPHKIINTSNNVRINMSIDMVPNEWVKNMIIGNN